MKKFIFNKKAIKELSKESNIDLDILKLRIKLFEFLNNHLIREEYTTRQIARKFSFLSSKKRTRFIHGHIQSINLEILIKMLKTLGIQISFKER